jgi:hypothetical protein
MVAGAEGSLAAAMVAGGEGMTGAVGGAAEVTWQLRHNLLQQATEVRIHNHLQGHCGHTSTKGIGQKDWIRAD